MDAALVKLVYGVGLEITGLSSDIALAPRMPTAEAVEKYRAVLERAYDGLTAFEERMAENRAAADKVIAEAKAGPR